MNSPFWYSGFSSICLLKLGTINIYGSSIPPQIMEKKDDVTEIINLFKFYYKILNLRHIISHQSCGTNPMNHCYNKWNKTKYRCPGVCIKDEDKTLITTEGSETMGWPGGWGGIVRNLGIPKSNYIEDIIWNNIKKINDANKEYSLCVLDGGDKISCLSSINYNTDDGRIIQSGLSLLPSIVQVPGKSIPQIKSFETADSDSHTVKMKNIQSNWDNMKDGFSLERETPFIGKQVISLDNPSIKDSITFDKMKTIADSDKEEGVLWNIHINDMTQGSVDNWITLYKLYKYIREEGGEGQNTLIHCLAGFGRTGTTLLLFSLLNDYDEYHTNPETFEIDNNYIFKLHLRYLTIKIDDDPNEDMADNLPEIQILNKPASIDGDKETLAYKIEEYIKSRITNPIKEIEKKAGEASKERYRRILERGRKRYRDAKGELEQTEDKEEEEVVREKMETIVEETNLENDLLRFELESQINCLERIKEDGKKKIELMAQEVTNHTSPGDPYLMDLYMSRLCNIIIILTIHINEKNDGELEDRPIFLPKKENGGWEYDILSYKELKEDEDSVKWKVWADAIQKLS